MSIARWLGLASRVFFTATWLLACLTPSWSRGFFARWPLATLTIAGEPTPVGAAMVLPTLAGVTGALAIAAGLRRPRDWALNGAGAAIIALGAWGLVRSWPVHRVVVGLTTLGGVAILWGVYVYGLRNWPTRWIVASLAALLALQGLVAMAQSGRQASLGLGFMGELGLDPQVRGVSVVELGGRRWLRAYGLTPHPNPLGGYLAIGSLVCLGALLQQPGRRRYLWIGLLPGSAGVLLSFSRSAWLAALAGLVYLVGVTRLWQRSSLCPAEGPGRWRLWLPVALLLLAVVVLLAGLLGARPGARSSELESNAISERVRDTGQAWMLIRARPLTGVGTGYYVDALWAWANATGRRFPAFQPVHNVWLLSAAELGLVGALLWLWLLLGPPLSVAREALRGPVAPQRAGWAAALLGMAVVATFDYYPYFLSTWWAALYLGALSAGWVQASHVECERW